MSHKSEISRKKGLLLAAGSKSRYLFEIVGTFIFVYAICSAATVYSGPNKLLGIVGLPPLAMVGLGLVHAFVLTALVYAINLALELSLIRLLQ